MPEFVGKNPKDEARWARAKKAASKSTEVGSESYWKLANYIYHNKGKKVDKSLTLSEAELEKGLKEMAAGAMLGAAALNPVSLAASVKMPSASQHIAHASPIELHDDLKNISMIESSYGKFKNHKKTTVGLNAGHTAGGSTGLMPITIKETVKKNPHLMAKYGHLVDSHPDHVTKFINQNPNVENEIANTHWKRLGKVFGTDTSRKAYAWRNGITAAKKASHDEITNHPYVKTFHKYQQAGIHRIVASNEMKKAIEGAFDILLKSMSLGHSELAAPTQQVGGAALKKKKKVKTKIVKLLAKIEEDLEKAWDTHRVSEPPQFEGQVHPEKPYIGRKHPNGKLSWFTNDKKAHETDSFVNEKAESYISKHPKEHQPLIRQFIRTVMASPTRHAIMAGDKGSDKPDVRARHIRSLLSGHEHVKIGLSGPQRLHFVAARHGQAGGRDRVDAWTFTPEGFKKGAISNGNEETNINQGDIFHISYVGRAFRKAEGNGWDAVEGFDSGAIHSVLKAVRFEGLGARGGHSGPAEASSDLLRRSDTSEGSSGTGISRVSEEVEDKAKSLLKTLRGKIAEGTALSKAVAEADELEKIEDGLKT